MELIAIGEVRYLESNMGVDSLFARFKKPNGEVLDLSISPDQMETLVDGAYVTPASVVSGQEDEDEDEDSFSEEMSFPSPAIDAEEGPIHLARVAGMSEVHSPYEYEDDEL